MEYFLIWFGFAAVVGVAASKRGRSGFGWAILAILISPLLAGLILLALPWRELNESNQMLFDAMSDEQQQRVLEARAKRQAARHREPDFLRGLIYRPQQDVRRERAEEVGRDLGGRLAQLVNGPKFPLLIGAWLIALPIGFVAITSRPTPSPSVVSVQPKPKVRQAEEPASLKQWRRERLEECNFINSLGAGHIDCTRY